MTDQTMWVIVIVAVVVVGVIGFFIGRMSVGTKQRVAELEEEIAQQKEKLTHYRQDVKDHFDRTAGLFVSMAGSYKELFDHLSKGYENLADGSIRELLNARVDSLLRDTTAQSDVAPVQSAPAAVTEPVEPVAEPDETLYTPSSISVEERDDFQAGSDNATRDTAVDDAIPILDDVVPEVVTESYNTQTKEPSEPVQPVVSPEAEDDGAQVIDDDRMEPVRSWSTSRKTEETVHKPDN